MAQKATRITTDSATPIASINDRLEDTTRARASLPIQETLAELVPKMPAGPVAHAEIRKRVLEEINKQRWTPPSKIEAKVEDGTVAAPRSLLPNPPSRSEYAASAIWINGEGRNGRAGLAHRPPHRSALGHRLSRAADRPGQAALRAAPAVFGEN